MQKHKNEKIEIAIFIGIIVILLVALTSMIRPDINSRVIDNTSLSLVKNTDFFWKALVITISSLVFVLSASSSLFSGIKLSKEEKKLREFISGCKQRGYADEEIIEMLNQHGWHKSDLDKYF